MSVDCCVVVDENFANNEPRYSLVSDGLSVSFPCSCTPLVRLVYDGEVDSLIRFCLLRFTDGEAVLLAELLCC